METMESNSLEKEQVLFSQMLLAVKTGICQTSAFGRITQLNSLSNTVCLILQKNRSLKTLTSNLPKLMKIQCRANSQTWFLEESLICLISKGQIMLWMQLVHHRWQRLWMPADYYKHDKQMSCLLVQPIERWILQLTLNSAQSVHSHQHIPRRSMHEQMDS